MYHPRRLPPPIPSLVTTATRSTADLSQQIASVQLSLAAILHNPSPQHPNRLHRRANLYPLALRLILQITNLQPQSPKGLFGCTWIHSMSGMIETIKDITRDRDSFRVGN